MKPFVIIYALFTQGNTYFLKKNCIIRSKIHFILMKKLYIFVKIL